MHLFLLLPSFQLGALITGSALLLYGLLRAIYNVFFHPLSHFPGPRGAACTRWWLAYKELCRGVSLADLRMELHQRYGDIVRISPNELHFARPTVYNEIYNAQNKWDKDYNYYRAFDADESFFTQTDYLKSKHSRALISNLFSRKTISDLQHLIRSRLEELCDALRTQNAAGKSSDIYLGFQCFSADTIATFCFSKCFNQLSFPDFHGDIVEGVDIAMPAVTLRKFSKVFVWILRNFPPSLLMVISPTLKGYMIFRKALKDQIDSILRDPRIMDDAPHRIIYRELLNPAANKGHSIPTALQLQHESEVLFAAGSHTVGSTLMTAVYYTLRTPDVKQRLALEMLSAWPVLGQPPDYEVLEKLPFLASPLFFLAGPTAVIKETLRLAISVPAGLPRIVPPSGAVLSGVKIPGGPESKALDNWLVSFSKGPRSCLGINLAYCEMYLALAYLFRRFDVREDEDRLADLKWSEHFLPLFEGQHLHAYCKPLDE
ncbi:putative P450 monooxygenase [Multifurca ochricompacta]|uniref:P450 monooxygenase n=1 Tax=Multifurca ochricompacta TaxID=376703 RepID=A0AAD4MB21_9AGAM|nr:putative P450 monooxygenase [Multifurca ochricompacta]